MKGSIYRRKDRGTYVVQWYHAEHKRSYKITRYYGELMYHRKIAEKGLATVQAEYEQYQPYSDSPGERVSLQMLDPQEDVKEAVELFLNHETFVFGFNLPSGLQGHTTFALAGLDEAIDPYLAEMGMADLREADSGRNSSNGSGCFLQTLKPLQ